jgi:hypothetical protein
MTYFCDYQLQFLQLILWEVYTRNGRNTSVSYFLKEVYSCSLSAHYYWFPSDDIVVVTIKYRNPFSVGKINLLEQRKRAFVRQR